MSYAFPGELQQLVQSELAKGVYASEDELLLVALKALREREQVFHSSGPRCKVGSNRWIAEKGSSWRMRMRCGILPMRSRRRAGDPGKQTRNAHEPIHVCPWRPGRHSRHLARILRLRIIAPMPPTYWSIELRRFLPCLQGNRCLERHETSWPPGFDVLSWVPISYCTLRRNMACE